MNGKAAEELFDRAFALYERGAYAEADALLRQEGGAYPDHEARILFWRMCLTTLAGQPEEAIRVFEQALASGHWYGERMLRADPDLAALQGRDDFERLVEECIARQAAAQAATQPYMPVLRPAAQFDAPYPALLALHANASSAGESARYWQPATGWGWLVALPQSTQVAASGMFNWSDREQALADLTGYYHSLLESHPVDQGCIVLGGMSLGAATAIRALLTGRVRARGFIAVVPAFGSADSWEPLITEAADSGLCGVMLLGEQDRYHYDSAVRVHEMMRAHGLDVRVTTYPDLSHRFPPGFEPVLQSALAFVTGG